MPAERVPMREAREIIRLKFSTRVATREIARRLGIAPSTVRETLKRLSMSGLSRPVAFSCRSQTCVSRTWARHLMPDGPGASMFGRCFMFQMFQRARVYAYSGWDDTISADSDADGREAGRNPAAQQAHKRRSGGHVVLAAVALLLAERAAKRPDQTRRRSLLAALSSPIRSKTTAHG